MNPHEPAMPVAGLFFALSARFNTSAVKDDFPFSRFLRRIRRRWIVWRIIECAGIGAAIGSLAGLTIVPVLLWRNESAMPTAIVLLLIAMLAGFFWAITHRPTLPQMAMRVDRQLGLHDLLGTALSSQNDDAEFRAVVLAMAEARCKKISPNELILRRLGGRAWGGIGIATALLLTVAMMSSQPPTSQAHGQSQSLAEGESTIAINRSQSMSVNSPPLIRKEAASDDAEASNDPSRFADSTASKSSANKSKDGDSAGVSAGQSDDGHAQALHIMPNDSQASANGQTLAGGGVASRLQNGGAGDGTLASQSSYAAKAWSASDWKTSRESALRDIQAGKIPDPYRDMVRDYFDRQSP